MIYKPDFDNLDTYLMLLKVCEKYKVSPSSSIESEEFFKKLLQQYPKGELSLEDWIDQQIAEHFLCLNQRPIWVQGYNWQFLDGKPMMFVGQIDVSRKSSAQTMKRFHDDTVFFVFMPNGKYSDFDIQVIVQQY